jgi:hypothetical protein
MNHRPGTERDERRGGAVEDSVETGGRLSSRLPRAMPLGLTKGGGLKWPTTARLSLRPEFLEPFGVRAVTDTDPEAPGTP